jgi:hypothetical protein
MLKFGTFLVYLVYFTNKMCFLRFLKKRFSPWAVIGAWQTEFGSTSPLIHRPKIAHALKSLTVPPKEKPNHPSLPSSSRCQPSSSLSTSDPVVSPCPSDPVASPHRPHSSLSQLPLDPLSVLAVAPPCRYSHSANARRRSRSIVRWSTPSVGGGECARRGQGKTQGREDGEGAPFLSSSAAR